MQLDKSRDHKHYTLSEGFAGKDGSDLTAILEVRHYYGTDNPIPYFFTPTFMKYGERIEILTDAEVAAQMEAVKMHEGDDAASKWLDDKVDGWLAPAFGDTNAYRANKVCEEMKKKFLALIDLGVFTISVTF